MNPFLKILNNPATGINVELNNDEQNLFVRSIEEKVNHAITEHTNVRIAHGQRSHDDALKPLNDWLWWLNNMWDGNMDYTFELQASNIGLTSYELYKIVVGILLERIANDAKIIHNWNLDSDMGKPINCTQQLNVTDIDDMAYTINDPNVKYDCEGKLDNDTLNALKITR